MTGLPDDNHGDELLAQIFTGSVDAGDPEVVARAQADPEFASRLAELQELDGAFAAEGELFRELRDAGGGTADDEQLVRGAIERCRDDRGMVGRRRWAVAAAAAAVLALTGWLVWRQDPLRRTYLGGHVVLEFLGGDLAAGTVLRWRGLPLPQGGYYRIEVFASAQAANPVWRSGELVQASYNLGATDLAAWPRIPLLRVAAYGFDDKLQDASERIELPR